MSIISEIEAKSTKRNYWLYSTIILFAIVLIIVIAFIAYQAGQQNSNNVVKNIEADNTERKTLTSAETQPQNLTPSVNAINSQTVESSNTVASSQSIPATQAISGEMFIVTKGRQNIKLALVEICAVPQNVILSWVKLKREAAVTERKKVEKKIEELLEQKQIVSSQLQNASDRNEIWKLQDKERELGHQLRLADINHHYWISPEYYLKGLVQCEFTTKTDSDGKFTLTLPSSKRYALAAQTNRQILDSSETYWWLIWTNPELPNQTIVFDNDNLMSENPPNKVIQVENYKPRFLN